MRQEDKDLLFKDLSARLPYGVKLKIKIYEDINEVDGIGTLYQLNKKSVWVLEDENERCLEYNKPYLFPLSSMTEEQKNQLEEIWGADMDKAIDYSISGEERFSGLCELSAARKVIDWLIANHFDFRGLIEKGLALDATGLNIY